MQFLEQSGGVDSTFNSSGKELLLKQALSHLLFLFFFHCFVVNAILPFGFYDRSVFGAFKCPKCERNAVIVSMANDLPPLRYVKQRVNTAAAA